MRRAHHAVVADLRVRQAIRRQAIVRMLRQHCLELPAAVTADVNRYTGPACSPRPGTWRSCPAERGSRKHVGAPLHFPCAVLIHACLPHAAGRRPRLTCRPHLQRQAQVAALVGQRIHVAGVLDEQDPAAKRARARQGHQGGSTSLLPAPLSVPARPIGVIRAAATHLWPPSSTTCLPPAALSACMPSPLFKVRTVQRFEPPQIAAVRSHYLLGAGLLEGGAHPHRAASGPGGGAPLGGGGGSAHGNHGGQAEGDRQEMLQRRLGAQESGLE